VLILEGPNSGRQELCQGVLKLPRKMGDATGTVDVDEVCPAASLSADDFRQCLDDLQDEGYLKLNCLVKLRRTGANHLDLV
jgi:hypothetical protein